MNKINRPFRLLDIPGDEIVVHVEQAYPDEVEDDIETLSQRHRLVISLTEGRHSTVLQQNKILCEPVRSFEGYEYSSLT